MPSANKSRTHATSKQSKTPNGFHHKKAKTARRKCTYAVRRQHQQTLREEIHRLESEAEVLKLRSSGRDHESLEGSLLKQATVANARLGFIARERQLEIAKAQSAISRCMGDQQSYPLYTRICLSKDWSQRQAKLVQIRDEKLRRAYNFVMAPNRYADPDKTRYTDEKFVTAQGDFCGVRLETVQFPGVKSLQQVYDAMVYYLTNMEISITEQLGHITVRDDYETIGGNVYNARVMSTNQHNVVIETSSLLFTKLDVDAGYGMVVLDSVDEDELYPYSPAERVRKDISATAVLTANRKKTSSNKDGELVVTLRGAAFLKIHRPQFELSDAALDDLASGILAWGDVMVKAIRDIVYRSC
ncbi:hypothetical protein PHYBOEH_007033 [Phytophthora boehmeriae]|uniref:Uncharacterized protein n=1 Tax=Phytophthora boehmeriae TaxID=109152 RepID=A0A8T1WEL5_9STRA|nr:hypothetical protein PHYBOEH_007033 [Phytophthora boehmeriae]